MRIGSKNVAKLTDPIGIKQARRKRTVAIGASAAGMIAAAGASVAQAASATWTSAPTDANWVTNGSETNWTTGIATFPGAVSSTTNTDIATFTGASALETITLGSTTLNIGGINFGGGSTADAYVVGASGDTSPLLLTSGGSIINSNTQAAGLINETVNSPLLIENVGGGSTGSGTYAITSNGTGTSATANNFLVINGGISGNAASGSTTTLTLNGSNNTRGLLSSNFVNGVIGDGANGGKLAVSVAYNSGGSTTWVLAGLNTYTGGTTLSGTTFSGTLQVRSDTALGTGALTVSGASGEILQAGAAVTLANTIAVNTNVNLDTNSGSGYAMTLNGVVSGTGATLTKTSIGTLALGAANTFSNQFAINAGSVVLGNATALGSGTTTTNLNTSSGSNSANVSSGSGLAVGNLVTGAGIPANTFITAISGTTVTLSRNATATNTGIPTIFTGTTTVASGATLDLAGQTSTETLATITGTGVGNNGALINSSATPAAIGNIGGQASGNPGSFTVGGANDLGNITVGNVAGASAFTLTKAGSQTLTLTGTLDNAFLGVIQNAGTVVVNKNASAGNSGANTYTLNAGTLQLGPLAATTASREVNNLNMTASGTTFDLNGAGGTGGNLITLTGVAGATITNSSASPAALTIVSNSGTANNTFAGTIGGSISLAKSGTSGSVATLSGSNTYTGGTTVTGGTLATGATGTFGVGNVNVNGGTLTLSNGTSIADGAAFNVSQTSVVILNAGSGISETVASLLNLTTSTQVPVGTYAATDLNNLYFGGNTVFSGSETLTIAAPEPTSLLSLALAGGSLVVARRRRRRI